MYTLTKYHTSGPFEGRVTKESAFFPAPLGSRGHCPNGGDYVVIGRRIESPALDRHLTARNRSALTL